MAGHSRSKNGVASLAYVPAISLMQALRTRIGMRGSSPRITERVTRAITQSAIAGKRD
jgi:hypothetical protein